MLARGASTEIDAVASNPAGLAFLPKDGLVLSLNVQSVAQQRNIDARYTTASLPLDLSKLGMGQMTLGGNEYSHYYKGKASAPAVPSFFAAYKRDKWVFSGSFTVVGGGGKCSFDEGLPMFESSVRSLYDIALGASQLVNRLNPSASALPATPTSDMYTVNSAMDGRQFIYGLQQAIAMLQKANPQLAAQMGGLMPASMLQEGKFDLALDCDQKGWGLTPIIGADVRYKGFTLGLKYEFMTNLNLENKTHKLVDPTGALKAFEDGVNTPSDIPAWLTVALGYDFLPTLRATVEYHRFFDKQASMADNKQKTLERGTNEYLAGIEWDAHKYVTLSGGFQRTDYGLSDEFQSDTSFSCDSYTLGFGAKFNLTDHVKVNVAYFWTNYSDYEKHYQSATASGTNVYSRTNKVFGVGVDYVF